MNLTSKKILVLGGTGLIGEEIVRKLPKENEITIVSLGSEADRKSFQELSKDFPNLKHITGNIFLPAKYKDKTFNELLDSDTFLEEYISLLYLKPNHKELFLNSVLAEVKPEIIIDSINSATVLSYTKNVSLIKDYLNGKIVKLETLLATLSIPRLISYFDCLYKSLQENPSVKIFLKIGTTGTGGMGFNIPYTHGEERPSHQLLEKAAISGAYTNLLFLLSETFGMPFVKEIKPAALVGYKKISFDKVSLGRNGTSLKVYEFNKAKRVNLKELRRLNFEDFKLNGVQEDFKAVFIDTGENGQFSLEEFRTIANERQMGFVTKEEIAEVVRKELSGADSGKDMIRAFKKTVMGPSKKAQEVKKEAITEMEKLVKNKKVPSLAFEVLGPPRLSKLIFEAFLIKNKTNFDLEKLDKWSFEQGLDPRQLSLMISTGIPVLLPDENLVIGKKPKVPSYDIEINDENIENWSYHGWVDLRAKNLELWEKRIAEVKKQNLSLEIGDIVAWIFENEDKGFRKITR